MSITTLISSIDRQTTYPVTQSGSAPDNCGLLCLSLNTTWTEQMIHELPTINVNIFMPDGSRLVTISVDMRTVNRSTSLPTNPYCIPLYNLPETFDFSITPLFDESALTSHNAQIGTGDFTSFITSDKGIIDTNPEDYKSLLWKTPTSTFDVTISFDNSNIVAGGGSGGGGGGGDITVDNIVTEDSPNPVSSSGIYDFVNSSVSTNTAYFIGTFNSVQELEDYSEELSNNDYAFVISTDVSGNTLYNRYKYNDADDSWRFEYSLNNSSFTANQWATINSRLVYADKTKLDSLAAVPEITGATTTTGSMTWSFTVTSDDATKLQGVRDGAYTAILFTPIVDGVKKSMLLRRTSSSGTPEFTGICVDHYANNLLTMYYAAGITANSHIVVSKFELTGNFTPTAGTGISVNPSTKAISIADISGLGTGTEKLYTVGYNAQGQITSATEVTMGAGMTMTNNVLNTSIVGEIMSEDAYSQLATKDKDIYFTYD